jgi:tRNA-2-methylthio-N6-dimethylallyladenosine synthase
MNKSDSERLAALLGGLGLVGTESERDADIIIVNTCSVRQSAEDRVFGKLKDFAALKERNPDLVVGVTGCLPGRDKDGKLRAKMPDADLFFPISEMTRLPAMLAGFWPDLVATGEAEADYLKIRPRYSAISRSFVTVQTGCNKFCTYCVVPYARGLEKNRPAVDILNEVRNLAARGAVEIALLGQAVNAYRTPDRDSFSADNPYSDDFAALLWEINRIPGIERIHWTAPYPTHMTEEVIAALTLPKQVNYLHLPVQAGNDEVLKRMNRRYTRGQYLEIIRKIRLKKPDIALGTDIIVGFSGETPKQFEDTVSMFCEADFDISYNAMYSPRSGTQAHKMYKDDVPRAEKRRRWLRLQEVMEENALRKNQAHVGREVEVLVERCEKGICSGNTREMKLARFAGGTELVGRLVRARVTEAKTWILECEMI